MASDIVNYQLENAESVLERFTKDLDALDDVALGRSWDHSTRSGYDFVYEVAVVNSRVARRMRGEDPGPMPWEFGKEWLKAPEDMRSKPALTAYVEDSNQSVIEAAKTFTGDDMQLIKNLNLVAMHTFYHDAQLNFLQAMTGDMAIHW